MSTKKVLVSTLLYLTSMVIAQPDEMPIREGYDGTRWGSSKEEFLAQNNHATMYKCSDDACYLGGPEATYGTNFFFTDNKLTSVLRYFDASNYSDIRGNFIGKYGRPSRRKTSTIQNAFGAKFQNEQLGWNGRIVLITLNRFDERLDRGSAHFLLRSAVNEYIKKQRGEQRKRKPVERF